MRVLVVGASGTIGRFVTQELVPRHEIVEAGKNHGQHQVDIAREDSVQQLFEAVGNVDAIVAVAGNVHWGPLQEMTADQFKSGLHEKLLGQVNLALIGQRFLNDGGSITLTSGRLSHDPYFGGTSFTTVNSAIDGFVRGAAIELERGCRINSVSPNVLKESWEIYGPGVPGTDPVPGEKVALAYRKSVEGRQSGQTFRVW